jgi:Na+/melibiose symporter-like transporter
VTFRRLSLIIALFIIGLMLVWLPYRISQADNARVPSVLVGMLLPLCVFAAAFFIAISAPERVRATK